MSEPDDRALIGWREWVGLPDLGVGWTKAKVDTGARSSAIHATGIRLAADPGGMTTVRFTLHPWQASDRDPVDAEATLIEERPVRSSNGRVELRPVIRTLVDLGGRSWPVDLTLTSRGGMGFRMLLGREALRGRLLIDPGRSYLAGTPDRSVLRRNRSKNSNRSDTPA